MDSMAKKELLKDWLKAKNAEKKATEKRHVIEKKIEKLYPLDKNKKSKTFKEKDLGFSIKIEKKFSTSLDQEKYIETRDIIPDNLKPEKIKYTLDTNGYEYLKKHEKEIYKFVSKCVIIKPGKTSIKVEKIKKGGKK